MILPLFIKSKIITRILSVAVTVHAICLFPFIFTSEELDEFQMNHELIHFEQQKELLVIGFYALYLYDYIKGMVLYKDKAIAYYNIRFEQEAYQNQFNLGYVDIRDKHSWKKYEV